MRFSFKCPNPRCDNNITSDTNISSAPVCNKCAYRLSAGEWFAVKKAQNAKTNQPRPEVRKAGQPSSSPAPRQAVSTQHQTQPRQPAQQATVHNTQSQPTQPRASVLTNTQTPRSPVLGSAKPTPRASVIAPQQKPSPENAVAEVSKQTQDTPKAVDGKETLAFDLSNVAAVEGVEVVTADLEDDGESFDMNDFVPLSTSKKRNEPAVYPEQNNSLDNGKKGSQNDSVFAPKPIPEQAGNSGVSSNQQKALNTKCGDVAVSTTNPFSFGSNKNKVSDVYNFNGKRFAVGQEEKAVDYIYSMAIKSFVFQDGSKTFTEGFKKLAKAYLIRKNRTFESFESKVRSISMSVSSIDELFSAAMIILSEKLVINDIRHAPYSFSTQMEFANSIANVEHDNDFIIYEHLPLAYLFLCSLNNPLAAFSGNKEAMRKEITKAVFTNNRTVNFIGDVKLIHFGTERQFLDSLLKTDHIAEKSACAKTIYDSFVNEHRTAGKISDEFKKILEISNVELVDMYIRNIEYVAARSRELDFGRGIRLTNNEQDLLDYASAYQNGGSNIARYNLLVYFTLYSIGFLQGKNCSNFRNINTYIEGRGKNNSIATFDDFVKSIKVLPTRVVFQGEHVTVTEFLSRLTHLDPYVALGEVILFNESQLVTMFDIYSLQFDANSFNNAFKAIQKKG